MLKLERCNIDNVLPDIDHRKALKKRLAAAVKLAARQPSKERGKSIRDAWNNFRAGKAAKGTCDLLWNELLEMSFQKCALCEVPGPGTIEHLEEKATKPERMFDWNNLLPACGDCNTHRENSKIKSTPVDPSNGDDPLDYLGWSEYGVFMPYANCRDRVDNHVAMYNLARSNKARECRLVSFKGHLFALTEQSTPAPETTAALQAELEATTAWLGPIREYLLRPPTQADEWLVDEALRRLPVIRTWVRPWLRPGKWAGSRWF